MVKEEGVQFFWLFGVMGDISLKIALRQYNAISVKVSFLEGCLQWQVGDKLEMMVPHPQSQ